MNNLTDVKLLLDAAFAALAAKGVNVTGVERSQLAKMISDSDLEDCTQINQFLTDELGEPVTDVKEAITKLTALKEALRQAIVAKGTLVPSSETLDRYAQKIRAIHSYSDLTFSGLMPEFILDPEPTGSTIVYMRPGASGDGTSWDNAMGDFVAAHASLSGSKNVIYMEEGVYSVTGDITLFSTAKIYGGFKANDHSWSARNSFANRTILDAQLTTLRLIGAANNKVDGLTIINARNTYSPFYNLSNCKNLIAQDCTNSGNGGGFSSITYSSNLVAINCAAYIAGGMSNLANCNNMIAINCTATYSTGGLYTLTGCKNILVLNCKATNDGGGLYGTTNCANAKIINCVAARGSGTYNDTNSKNILIVNCQATFPSGGIVFQPSMIQNYTIVNCKVGSTGMAIMINGGASLAVANKLYNCVCLNNKNSTDTLVGIGLNLANSYYILRNCRADAAIGFAANAATNADIQNFYLIQNNNSETKFNNAGTYPTVGNLPYDNNVINQKYIDGSYGNFNIPADSVLAGAGYWEDGFSFGWDIDGKPRNATHCSIGAYEPNWA